jgi:hypothetical protein
LLWCGGGSWQRGHHKTFRLRRLQRAFQHASWDNAFGDAATIAMHVAAIKSGFFSFSLCGYDHGVIRPASAKKSVTQ